MITPLRLAGGELVLVNRGWLAADGDAACRRFTRRARTAAYATVYVPPGRA